MLRVLTGGESHGPSLTAIIEGLPSGLIVDFYEVDRQLKRRQGGYGRGDRQKIETDTVEIISGVRFGRTLGSPVTLLVRNRDFENWLDRMSVRPVNTETPPIVEARPGHADFAGMMKYATDDLRNILERSSARNTASIVAVGTICRLLLKEIGVHVMSHVSMLGGIHVQLPRQVNYFDVEQIAENSPVRVANPEAEAEIIAAIDKAGEAGDTLGGIVEIVAVGCPPGLGSHVHWDRKLDSRLAGAVMGIQAIKGVEIGLGFGVADRLGSLVHDELFHGASDGFTRSTNHAGGLEGGMTNGEPVVVRAAMKPLSTLKSPLRSVNLADRTAVTAHFERSDVCAVPAAGVICEAVVSMVLAEAVVEKFGGDSMEELLRNYRSYVESIEARGVQLSGSK
ncbi:MAG: chorismate synthase [Chthonomonadales bacterium]